MDKANSGNYYVKEFFASVKKILCLKSQHISAEQKHIYTLYIDMI
jgi:hypothetical protein